MPEPNNQDDYRGLEQDLADLHRPVVLDPKFAGRLESRILERAVELSAQRKARRPSRNSRWRHFASTGRLLSWGAAAVLLVLVLAWGINHLIPGGHPAAIPSPAGPSSGWGKVAYLQGGNLWVKTLPDGEPQLLVLRAGLRPVSSGRGISQPRWSFSGEWLAFREGDDQIWLAPLAGGEARPLDDGPNGDFEWSPVEDRIAYIHKGTELRLRFPGGQEAVILAAAGASGQIASLSWSPDGRWIAYELRERPGDGPAEMSLWVVPVEGDGPVERYRVREAEIASGVYRLFGWTSDSRSLVFWQGNPFTSASMGADGVALALLPVDGGAPQTIAERVLLYEDFVRPDPSGSSRLAVVDGARREAWTNKRLVLIDAGGRAELAQPGVAASSVSWAPDGSRLAYAAGPDLGDEGLMGDPALLQRHLWLTSLDGTQVRQLTGDPEYADEHPEWRRDGQGLLFARRSTGGQASLWLLAGLEGETQPQLAVEGIDLEHEYYGHVDWARSYDWWQPVRQPAEAAPTPLPAPTPEGQTTEEPSIYPTPTSPAGALGPDSAHDEIRRRILSPTWDTLWIQGQAKLISPVDEQQNFYVQAWLGRGGAGRVLSTDQIPGDLNFNLDMIPRWAWISDGGALSLFDAQTGQPDPRSANRTWFVHPLETAGQVTEILFPSYLAVRSEDLQVVEMSEQAGRPALVVDWAYFRLWVDAETGVILRQQTRGENGQVSQDVFLIAIAYDLPLPDGALSTENLEQSRFEPPPDREILPELPVLTPDSVPSPQAGVIYFELSGEPPFQWRMAALPAGCLASGSPCPEPHEIPERPEPQLFMSWSHDGRKAVFSDTNFDRLWAFDPASYRWQIVVDDSYQVQLAWSQNDRRLAAATVESDPNQMNLVWIDTEDWSVHPIPTSLKGNKNVIAWLDERTLAVNVLVDSFKGGEPEWIAEFQPGLYRVDVETGEYQLVQPWDAGYTFAPASLSPDGRYFLTGAGAQGQPSLALADLDFQPVRSLNVSGDPIQWSPDGEWISLTGAGQKLSLVRLDGTLVETGLSQVLRAVWSPDSDRLLVQTGNLDTNDRLWLVSTGGEVREVEIPALKESYIWSLLGWQRPEE